MPETSCSNALEGLLHHGCWLSLPGPLWLNFYINFTLVAFRSFILCFQDGYNKALCNDEL